MPVSESKHQWQQLWEQVITGGWGWRLPPCAEDERSLLQCAQHESLWCRPKRRPHCQLRPWHLWEGELLLLRIARKKPFLQVGRGVAHDEYIEFSIEGNTILYQVCSRPAKILLHRWLFIFSAHVQTIIWWSFQGEESEISAGKIRVEFIKSYRDNPKINSIVLIKVSKKNKFLLVKCSTIHCSGDIGRLPQAGSTPCRARGGWSCRWSQG